jgi:NAD+ synthase (glutamine-hydrolysing)
MGEAGSHVLLAILATEISPELVPGGRPPMPPGQKHRRRDRAYELQDFNLYYTLRYGFTPAKVAFLALGAWGTTATPAPGRGRP